MSDILVVEKNVAPHTSWTTIIDEFPISGEPMCAIKVKFDRAYLYFWVAASARSTPVGLALTMADVERAAIFDGNELVGFDIYSDGVLPLDEYNSARCIAMGTRSTFYVLSYSQTNNFSRENRNSFPFSRIVVSAQDFAVCPFVGTRGPVAS